jgi:hypothetical protein
MSEVAQVALITGGIGLLTVLITQFFNVKSRRDDREEREAERREERRRWYRRTLFDKRFVAAQEAYAWIMKLNRYASQAARGAKEDSDALRAACVEAREWYDNNAAFLYDNFPRASQFIGFVNTVGSVNGGGSEFAKQLTQACDEVRGRLNHVLAGVDALDEGNSDAP